MHLSLSPKVIFKINIYLILFLLFATALTTLAKAYINHNSVSALAWWFNFDTEKNIPSIYSAMSLFITSALLYWIAYARRKMLFPFLQWSLLSFIFLVLSMDELLSLHEELISPVRNTLNTTGFLHYAWVIPYGIALVIFIAAYTSFLFKLPKNIMRLFIISGILFVVGAIGFEMLGGQYDYLHKTRDSAFYWIISTSEELLEMLGIATFIYALLSYATQEFGPIEITISD